MYVTEITEQVMDPGRRKFTLVHLEAHNAERERESERQRARE